MDGPLVAGRLRTSVNKEITMSDIIRELEKEQLRSDLPKLEIGDTVRVYVKVVEGNRERLQNFEGIVIKMQGGGIRKTFSRFYF